MQITTAKPPFVINENSFYMLPNVYRNQWNYKNQ